MLLYENHCCDCATASYPCRGSSCPNRRVPVYYCDKCGAELVEVYEVGNEELCEDCLKDMFRRN